MTIFEMATKYYNTLYNGKPMWGKDRLKTLVENVPQRLTPEEYKTITGEEYVKTM